MRGWRAQGKFCLVAVAAGTMSWLLPGPADVCAQSPEALYRPRTVPDVPEKRPSAFAVMPFENRSGVSGLDWMSAGVPFMVGEKSELNSRMRPSYGPLVVPPRTRPVAATPGGVLAFARKHGAQLVFTGSFERPNWELKLSVTLWRIQNDGAEKIGTVTRQGVFKDVHRFIAESLVTLCERAGLPFDSHARAAVQIAPTKDFYAFTVFGRGVDALAGVTAEPDLVKAGKSLSRSVLIDPKLSEAWRVMARYDIENGKPAKAAARLSRALDIRPSYYPALIARADLSMAAKKLDRAAELYERALTIRPWDLEPRYRLGAVYWELTRIDDSFRELERVVKADPKNVKARRLLVMIHAAKGHSADLVRELEAVAQLDPRDMRTQMDLAAAYVSVGRSSDAVRAYKAVLALQPKNVQALKFLGDLQKQRGEVVDAASLYRQAIKVKPNDPRAYFLLGALYVEQGDDKSARVIYQRAQRFKAYQPEVFNNIGAIAYRTGRVKESLWYLKRAVSKKPNRAQYRYNYALSLSALNRTADALEQVDAGLKLAPEHVELHYLRGVALLRLGNVDQAEVEFRNVLAKKKDHENARHNLEMLEQLARRAREGEVVVEGR